jgi:hypothetical protein
MPAVSDVAGGLGQVWTQILDFLSKIVSPDWGALVNLLPVFLAPLVVLFLAGFAGAWLVYGLRKPRARLRYVEGPRPADRDETGDLLFPPGYPFDAAAGLVYPPGATRSDRGAPLAVACPMCRVERSAEISTCGNCGLVLRIAVPVPLARPVGPPPGGAAVA